jgi:hypothetical protein
MTALSDRQLARAEALDRARHVLAARGLAGAGKIEFPHEVTGLARFILDGTDVFNDTGAVAE